MSHDLFFLTRRPQPVSLDAFQSYFASRPHYTLQGNDASQALYENDDTGVYFSFDYSADGSGVDEAVDPDLGSLGWSGTGMSFNLNYWRPHIFGLEAEPEVGADLDPGGA